MVGNLNMLHRKKSCGLNRSTYTFLLIRGISGQISCVTRARDTSTCLWIRALLSSSPPPTNATLWTIREKAPWFKICVAHVVISNWTSRIKQTITDTWNCRFRREIKGSESRHLFLHAFTLIITIFYGKWKTSRTTTHSGNVNRSIPFAASPTLRLFTSPINKVPEIKKIIYFLW